MKNTSVLFSPEVMVLHTSELVIDNVYNFEGKTAVQQNCLAGHPDQVKNLLGGARLVLE